MQLFSRQVSHLFQPNTKISRKSIGQRSALAIVCAAVVLSAALAPGLAVPDLAVLPEGAEAATLKLADPMDGIRAQIVFSDRTRINPEAFNFKREREIADDTAKLLKLAIALKAEIENNPDAEPSAEALAKAKQIEKLAKNVKSRMRTNPVLERP